MSIICRLTNLKTDLRLTERCYDDICAIVNEVLQKKNMMVNNFYETKKQIAAHRILVEKIYCCPNECMIYWGNNANATCFYICETSRWRRNSNGDKVLRKQFHYFPLGPRLQRLCASEATARHMRWHADTHGHGPGWACSIPVPPGSGSIWNLSRPVPVPGGSKRFLGGS